MNRKSAYLYLLPVVFAAVQFLPGLLPTVGAAELAYVNTFDSGWGDTRFAGGTWQTYCDKNNNFSIVPDPTNSGNKVAKFYQKGTEACTEDFKHRVQVHLEDSTGSLFKFLPHLDYFIGWRVFIPNDFPASALSSNNQSIIHWSMAQASPGETLTNLTGVGNDPAIEIIRRYDTGNGLAYPSKKVVLLNRGSWNTVVLHVKREWTKTGTLKAWVNGEQVMNETNVQTATNTTVNPKDPVTKVGIYWGTVDRPFDVTINVDDFRVATGADGYNLVSTEATTSQPPAAPSGLQINISQSQ